MRHLSEVLRRARRGRGWTQAALAERSGASRVTIARIEAEFDQDFRLGTLARICEALQLQLNASPPGAEERMETLLARGRERSRRLDLRRRHAALAARLLLAPPVEARTWIRQARANVEYWKSRRLCSSHYISRWNARLAGSPRRVAQALLEHDDWTDALLQNSPWGFALEPPAP
jgi:transcriptional regulator with XRE-family HTH domain